MRAGFAWTMAALAFVAAAGTALAQQKATVSGYLQQGYQIINSTFGGAYLIFVLKKDAAVVMCSVTVETGQTAGCQVIK